MTWEQKLAAIKALSFNVALWMRKPGDWCVTGDGLERTDYCILEGSCITGAKTWVHDAITRCRIENILRFAEDIDQGVAMAATSTPGTGTAG